MFSATSYMSHENSPGSSRATGTAEVEFQGVSREFSGVYALRDLNVKIPPGQFLTFLGPSGCGKTTALRLLAGFIAPTAGNILINNSDVTRVPVQRRGIGMVFQDYALFPHLTVRDNIAFGLVERRYSNATIEQTVNQLLDIVSLASFGARYPSQLSGGQKQRVAVARALAIKPTVLLMDEPLGALDVKLRVEMQSELRRIQQETGVTTIYVTHDQDEAFNISDRIVIMRQGRVMQIGSGPDIYERPSSPFVADFVGRINLIRGRWDGRDGEFANLMLDGGASIRIPVLQHCDAGQRVVIGIRPEHLRLRSVSAASPGIKGRITATQYAGDRQFTRVTMESGITLTAQTAGIPQNAGTDIVEIQWPADRTLLWPDDDNAE